MLPTPVFLGFLCGSAAKESTCNAGDSGFDPWVGKSPWRMAWQPTPDFLPGESPWTEEMISHSTCLSLFDLFHLA